jgi:hypothetical protein
MRRRPEVLAFGVVLAACLGAFFHETLLGGKVLSSADVLFISASFRGPEAGEYEAANRLLMDPVLQFQPWLEFNRRMIRNGRLPLWNGYVGCGAPHLANGQSAVFDPFHLLAYLGPTPRAYAWIAAGRLWVAGLGMFLLARSWRLGVWGCWFSGLVYPLSGFLVLWLLFPVTAVAIWMPWLFLATDRVFRSPGPQAAGWLAVAIALVILGGHIQTSAHVLLGAGFYGLASGWRRRRRGAVVGRAFKSWTLGTSLGLALASVQILPLGFYLAKSPVWGQRQRERPPWWTIAKPRVLDAVCTAVPYAYGSQRRGQPNLARAVGVHNLNESAGGFAGLATVIWLAPLAVLARGRSPRVRFLTGTAIFGALGAFGWPPVDNLLRSLPVLDVTDHRRLTLWIAFALTLLGGIGLDHLTRSHRLSPRWILLWFGAALALLCAGSAIGALEPQLRERALAHYRRAAAMTPGADPSAYELRAERQIRQVVHFLPRYYAIVAGELIGLGALALTLKGAPQRANWIRPVLLGSTLVELFAMGYGLNPAIDPKSHQFEPSVIARLREELPPHTRAIGLGEELPPNVLMRFGLSDVRNYDSVELARSLAWLAPLYGELAGAPCSSRSEITWERVVQARDLLRESGVGAIVAASPPPEQTFERVERVGRVWVAWTRGKPWVDSDSHQTELDVIRDHGSAHIKINSCRPDQLVIRETWDQGWSSLLDGKPVRLEAKHSVFLGIRVPAGRHELVLKYDPVEVRIGLAVSFCSLVLLILVLTGIRLFWIPGLTLGGGLEGSEPPG